MDTIVKSQNLIFMISNISAFLEEGISTCNQDSFIWETEEGEIWLFLERKEILFVDWDYDMKTTFAIIGLALLNGFTTADYNTENNQQND